jgi:YD repeat-containing protein
MNEPIPDHQAGGGGPTDGQATNTTLTYTYDAIYQLQLAKQGATTQESYSYDPVENRLSSLGVSP